MMRSRREEQRLLKWKQENDVAREAEAKRLAEEAERGEPAQHSDWPPATNHAPVKACLSCGSDDLVETRDSAIMMTVKDTRDANYVAYPTLVNIVVCRRCGRLEMFANDTSTFLSGYQHGKQTPRSLPGVPFPHGAPPPWLAQTQSIPNRDGWPPQRREPEPTAPMVPVTRDGDGDGEVRKTRYRRRATDRVEDEAVSAATAAAAPAEPEPKAKARRTTRRIEKLDR